MLAIGYDAFYRALKLEKSLSLVEGGVEATFAAADGSGQDDVGKRPKEDVEGEDEGDADMTAQMDVDESEEETDGKDGGHGDALIHAESKEFVMNVILILKEGANVVAQTV